MSANRCARPSCKNFAVEGAWCRLHDPALAAQRKAWGATRKPKAPPPPELPPGWSPRWRAPKWMRQGDTSDKVTRARQILEGHLPPPEELRLEALRVLRSVALEPEAAEASRVGACKALLEATAPTPKPESTPDANDASTQFVTLEEQLRQ